MKRPKLGDVITHTHPVSLEVYEGTVVQLLSAQFAYETNDGVNRLCMFSENWRFRK